MIASRVGRPLDTVYVPSGRAAYGKQILVTASRELTSDYGRGFSCAEFARMIQFAQAFPVEAIVVTLSQQLSCKTSNPRQIGQPLETGCCQWDLASECRRVPKPDVDQLLEPLSVVPRNLTFAGGGVQGLISESAAMFGQRLLPLAMNGRCRPIAVTRIALVDRPLSYGYQSITGRRPMTASVVNAVSDSMPSCGDTLSLSDEKQSVPANYSASMRGM
jgi:DUF1016 N-terminal domain